MCPNISSWHLPTLAFCPPPPLDPPHPERVPTPSAEHDVAMLGQLNIQRAQQLLTWWKASDSSALNCTLGQLSRLQRRRGGRAGGNCCQRHRGQAELGGGGTGHRQHQHKRRQVAPPPQLASTQAAGAPAPPEALLVQCQHALAISQAPHLRGHSSATQLVPGAAAPTGREAFLSWRLSTHPPRFLRQNQQHRWHCYPLPSLLLHHNTPSGSYPGPLMRPCSGAGMW